jgi:hypothetical protein
LRVVRPQPVDGLLDEPVPCCGCLIVRQAEALGDVQALGVDPVGGQPLVLRFGQRAKVQQALVLDQAAQPDPLLSGQPGCRGVGRRSGVHQFGRDLRVAGRELGVHSRGEVADGLLADGAADDADRPLLGDAVLPWAGDPQVALARAFGDGGCSAN